MTDGQVRGLQVEAHLGEYEPAQAGGAGQCQVAAVIASGTEDQNAHAILPIP
jgi:hypothetical protein